MKKRWITLALMATGVLSSAIAAPRLELKLKTAEEAAIQRSPAVLAAGLDRLAAERLSHSQKSSLFPQLGLDGSYKVVDELPSLTVSPLVPPMVFGDHKNWTVGVSASWTVWDWGALKNAWRSSLQNTAGRAEAERQTKRQVRLAVRSAYLQIRLACEQTRLVSDSLRLALAQQKDVENRVKVGAAGRLDLSAARQETLARRRALREARSSLSASLRDLLTLMGQPSPGDPSLPIDSTTAEKLPEGIEEPTLVVGLEPIGEVLVTLGNLPPSASAEDQPQARQWEAVAESARHQALSAKAGLLPRIQVSGRSSYDYPNQSVRETVQQNTAMVSATMPLFDWGRARKQTVAAKAQADAADVRRRGALDDWRRDVAKASDLLQALKAEAELDKQSSQEAVAFSDLVREAYRSGRSTYLEVDTANLKALQAQVQSVRTSIQVLLQAAVLASLTTD